MNKREFKITCSNCGNEDVITDDYTLKEDNKFEFNYGDGIFYINCNECNTELNFDC